MVQILLSQYLLFSFCLNSAVFAFYLRDSTNAEFDFPTSPLRIVALTPAVAEAFSDLGLSKRLVGIPEFTRIDEAHMSHVAVLGPYTRINPEAVFALKPDLVIANVDGNDQDLVKKLKAVGLKVFIINTVTLSGIYDALESISKIGGFQKDPPQLRALQQALALPPKVYAKEKRPRIFIQIGWSPLISVNKSSFLGEIIESTGAKNIFANLSTRYPRLNPEEVVAANPSIIVICKLTPDDKNAEKAAVFWRKFRNVEAVSKNQVFIFPPNQLTMPGFSLSHGIQELRKLL